MKKIQIPSEVAYFISIITMSFSVAMVSAADLGLSMVVAPAYIVSQALGFLTFGQSEYVVQALLLIAFCLIVKRFRPLYLVSFGTCLIYGAMLDFWRTVIPMFNPLVTAPGSMDWPIRIAFFLGGSIITAFAVALSFHSYLYPQMYDYFVKGVAAAKGIERGKVKRIYDLSSLAVAVVLTLVIFGKFVGVGVATIVTALINSPIIGWFDRLFTRRFAFPALFPKLENYFEKG